MLGAKKVGVAAKWEPSLLNNVKTYLEEAGFELVGVIGNAHTAAAGRRGLNLPPSSRPSTRKRKADRDQSHLQPSSYSQAIRTQAEAHRTR